MQSPRPRSTSYTVRVSTRVRSCTSLSKYRVIAAARRDDDPALRFGVKADRSPLRVRWRNPRHVYWIAVLVACEPAVINSKA